MVVGVVMIGGDGGGFRIVVVVGVAGVVVVVVVGVVVTGVVPVVVPVFGVAAGFAVGVVLEPLLATDCRALSAGFAREVLLRVVFSPLATRLITLVLTAATPDE
ncbi:MAG TPA: hypothetical protein VII05_06250 [Gaiellaceae bacterium]